MQKLTTDVYPRCFYWLLPLSTLIQQHGHQHSIQYHSAGNSAFETKESWMRNIASCLVIHPRMEFAPAADEIPENALDFVQERLECRKSPKIRVERWPIT